MKCSIIQDLLPLYCDRLTSEESNEEIEKHLCECEECNSMYENMLEKDEKKIQPPEDIQPLKKVRKRNLIKILAGISGTAVVGTLIFVFAFWGVIPARSDKVQLDISVYDHTVKSWYFEGEPIDGVPIEEYGTPEEHVEKTMEINFISDYGCTREETDNKMEFNEDGTITSHYEITIYPEIKNPFDDRGEHPNFTWYIPVHDDDDETFTIHYRDKDVTYCISDLAEQYE